MILGGGKPHGRADPAIHRHSPPDPCRTLPSPGPSVHRPARLSTTGMYTAPGSNPIQQNVTVTATSQANPNLSGSAVVTLLAGLQSDLYLTNMNISSGATTYQAKNSDHSRSQLPTVSGSATVTFVAGNSITLGPGFSATAGTAGVTFTTTINPGVQ